MIKADGSATDCGHLCLNVVSDFQADTLELYSLANDIGEANNVATESPAVVDRIEAFLKNARTESKEFPTRKIESD